MKEIMGRAKKILEKYAPITHEINEMGQVGKFSNVKVRINSTDHPPAHVHLIKDRALVAKVIIPEDFPSNANQVNIIQRGTEYRSEIITKFVKWLSETNSDGIVNLVACRFMWTGLHPEE